MLIGLIQYGVPLMVFPLYNSMKRVDLRLLRASRNLGPPARARSGASTSRRPCTASSPATRSSSSSSWATTSFLRSSADRRTP
ncbi:hypothetical protein [Leucobacter soli]|uniref:hypothetical protein n=1 Tax=Leucobacter soli TaxID=2812850 RepID=UPI0036237E30